MRLQDKVALITGATGGIGAATVKRFVAEGARVVAVDLDAGALDSLVADVGTDQVHGLAADVSDAEAVAASVNATVERFGQLDIAFLNAGIEGAICKTADYSVEDFDRVMAVNVRGVFLGIKYAVPAMQRAGGGSIIVTSSLGGLRGQAKISAYIASKHAVMGLMKSAALEYAVDGIRVNTINPSPIATRMIHALEEGYAPGSADVVKQKMERAVPLRRYGQPEEVAALALFLASDEASFITGNSYPVDGGVNAG